MKAVFFKYFVLLNLIIISYISYSQVISLFRASDIRIAEMQLNCVDSVTHSSIKPLYEFNRDYKKNGFPHSLYLKFSGFKKIKFITFNLYPLYETFGGINTGKLKESNIKEKFPYLASAGVGFNFNISDKLGISHKFRLALFNLPDYLLTTKVDVLNGYGTYITPTYKKEDLLNLGFNTDFKITYLPYSFLKMELGNGKNFFGDGYRSLLLSENSPSYRYFKIETEFLYFKYVCLWTLQHGSKISFDLSSGNRKKYDVFHYLDVAIGKKVNIGIFEAVISSSPNFDYFNPVIFFRPVEFSNGGTDNVLLGLNLKYNFYKNYSVYSQFILDDIIVRQIFNDLKHKFSKNYTGEWGWFANKWAFQLGIKGYDVFTVENLDFFAELNIARPYIYSHNNVLGNYSHSELPLAHPLGANFVESVFGINYELDRQFAVNQKIMFAEIGLDISTSTHYGQNIFLPTMDAVQYGNIAVNSYGNSLLQGEKTMILTSQTEFSIFINEYHDLSLNIGFLYRLFKNSVEIKNIQFLYIGFRCNIPKLEMVY